MPLATIGGFGSNGMAFLLTVMPALPQRRFRGLSGEPAREHVDEHQVIVGAAADQAEAAGDQHGREPAGVDHDLLLILDEGRFGGFLQAHGLGRDDVHQRPALHAGNTALSRSLAYCSRHSTMPALGPRSVLCVVVVTKSECGTGLGCCLAATRPAMCAMSVTIGAPTLAWPPR